MMKKYDRLARIARALGFHFGGVLSRDQDTGVWWIAAVGSAGQDLPGSGKCETDKEAIFTAEVSLGLRS